MPTFSKTVYVEVNADDEDTAQEIIARQADTLDGGRSVFDYIDLDGPIERVNDDGPTGDGWRTWPHGDSPIECDRKALDEIAHMLRDPEWGVGMLEDIADAVTYTGRSLDNQTGEPTWHRH